MDRFLQKNRQSLAGYGLHAVFSLSPKTRLPIHCKRGEAGSLAT
ncbi:hypothetical protein [Aneurinibacillus sp. REN35]